MHVNYTRQPVKSDIHLVTYAISLLTFVLFVLTISVLLTSRLIYTVLGLVDRMYECEHKEFCQNAASPCRKEYL